MLDQTKIAEALRTVKDVGGTGDIVSNDRIRDIEIDGARVKLTLFLATSDRDEKRKIEDACFDALNALEGVGGVQVVTAGPQPAQADEPKKAAPHADRPPDFQMPIPGVNNIIAVASGKGGVGKSTICVNLALALRQRGASVGLLDADIYGPSLHILLGVYSRPMPGVIKEIAPVVQSGLKLMSLGFMTDTDLPVIWRGPIVAGVVKKFLQDVEWGELDYLMVDLPPGTGDAQLTLVQTVPITGAIVVTTPSELAVVDAEKGLKMFEQVHAPVLGIIENMSTFVCPHCGEKTDIFDSDGGKRIAERTSTELLGQIPLDPRVRADGDVGKPIVKSDIDSPVSQAFLQVADRIIEKYPIMSK